MLKIERLEFDKLSKGTADIEKRIARAHPIAFLIALLDLKMDAATLGNGLKRVHHEPRREQDRTTHEDRVSHLFIAKLAHHALGAIEIVVCVTLDRRV